MTLAAAALIAIVAVLMLAPAARASDPPIFFTICDVSHYGKDDPIVHPGEPGTSHDHMFSGAWSTNANSTFASLQRSGTTCELEADTAAYWAPTLLDGNNNPIRGTFFAYFTAGIHEGPVARADIKAPPAGLRIVADASGSRPDEGGWHCGEPNGPKSLTTIPTCPGGLNQLQALIGFPDCWDGVHLDSADHRSHMAYARRNAATARIGCPASHPVPIASLSLKIRYQSYGGPGVHISSGGPETLHADFFNAWKQAELERLTKRCINDEFRNGEPCRNPQDATRTYEPTPNPKFPNATQPASAPVEPGCSPAPVLTPAVWTSGAVTLPAGMWGAAAAALGIGGRGPVNSPSAGEMICAPWDDQGGSVKWSDGTGG